MSVDFVVADTGGGKGVYTLIQILRYLFNGQRVATNMDLYLEHFPEQLKDVSVTRVPDMPTRQHLLDMGFGSPADDKNKRNYGLLALDEISLFLASKRDKEFMGAYNWYKQRRKFHWDIIFIAQHESQIQDEFADSLCKRLVICSEKDLIPVPFLGPLLRMLGFSGNNAEGHFFEIHLGKSRMNRVVMEGEYDNKPYRKMYDTDQFFDDGHEFLEIGDDVVNFDMRANFTYLPKSYLVDKDFLGIKYRERLEQERLAQEQPQQEEETAMAINRFERQKNKMKLIFGFTFVAAMVIYIFNLDFSLSPEKEAVPVAQTAPVPVPAAQPVQPQLQQVEAEPEPETDPEPFDMVQYLFTNFDYRLLSRLNANGKLSGTIGFFNNEDMLLHQKFSFEDIELFGYQIVQAGRGVWVIGNNQKYVVTDKPDLQQLKYDQAVRQKEIQTMTSNTNMFR